MAAMVAPAIGAATKSHTISQYQIHILRAQLQCQLRFHSIEGTHDTINIIIPFGCIIREYTFEKYFMKQYRGIYA